MSRHITAPDQHKAVDVHTATRLLETEPRSEGYRARAAECQQVADRWSGLIKRQYEDLARLWLTVAELAERK